jgi:ferritin-like metal-binding protein YciE
MSETTAEEQLTKYLTDAHSIEEQAIAQLRLAPRIAGTPELARIFAEHLRETEEQERRVREQLERHGAKPSTVKDVAGRVGGFGMALFARFNPDTPGKLVAHSYSYEHMEVAAYELLRRIADEVGDPQLGAMAAEISAQELSMAQRIEQRWDMAVDASLREKGSEDIRKDVVKYLRDAHALEAQAIQLLDAGPKLAGIEPLNTYFREHLEQSRRHQQLVDERLSALGARPARFQAGVMRLGALNLGAFFGAQPDTPAKLAGFAYAFEALEVASYQLLRRTARRAGDEETAAMAERIVADEEQMADRLAGTWDVAAQEALREQGVTAYGAIGGAQAGAGRD